MWFLLALANVSSLDLTVETAKAATAAICGPKEKDFACNLERMESFYRMKRILEYPGLKPEALERISKLIEADTTGGSVDWYRVERDNDPDGIGRPSSPKVTRPGTVSSTCRSDVDVYDRPGGQTIIGTTTCD